MQILKFPGASAPPQESKHKAQRRKSRYSRREQEQIDDDLHVSIFRPATSSFWYVQFNDSRGQHKRSLRTSNVKEARRRAGEVVQNLRKGDEAFKPKSKVLIAEVVETFLEDRKLNGCRSSTLRTYRNQLQQFVQFMSEARVSQLGQLRPEHLTDYHKRLLDRGVALPRNRGPGRHTKANRDSSIHEKLKLVKSVAKFALRRKFVRENPVAEFQLPKEGNDRGYCYTPDEVNRICSAAEPYFTDVFRFLAYTGLRESELIWLRKEDVQIRDRQIRAVSICKKTVKGVIWRPKTGDGRTVPLSPSAREIVQRYLTATPESELLFPAPPGPGVRDDRLRARRLCAHLTRAKKAAKVKQGTVHSFRHFFVTVMTDGNVPDLHVMAIVGHSDYKTYKRYYHQTNKQLETVVAQVDIGALIRGEGVGGHESEK